MAEGSPWPVGVVLAVADVPPPEGIPALSTAAKSKLTGCLAISTNIFSIASSGGATSFDFSRRSFTPLSMDVASTVPMIAMPSALPTWRIVLLPPDAIPALRLGVSNSTRLVSWAIANPSPRPYSPRISATEVVELLTSSTWLRITIATASTTMPVVTIHLGPILAENDPASGAAKKAITASGSSATPVLKALKPWVPCRYSETANSTPISPRLTIMPVIMP